MIILSIQETRVCCCVRSTRRFPLRDMWVRRIWCRENWFTTSCGTVMSTSIQGTCLSKMRITTCTSKTDWGIPSGEWRVWNWANEMRKHIAINLKMHIPCVLTASHLLTQFLMRYFTKYWSILIIIIIRFVARTYPRCWVLKARIQKHRGKPLLFHDKYLAQGHKRRDRPGRDSNPYSGNTRNWVQCTRPLGHNCYVINCCAPVVLFTELLFFMHRLIIFLNIYLKVIYFPFTR